MSDSRSLVIKQKDFEGQSVVYIMSRDQRVNDNHALISAQELAIKHGVPIYVLFVLKKVANRSYEHYKFMLDGLEEVSKNLQKLGIQLVIRNGEPKSTILEFSDEVKSGALYFDFNPLKGSRTLIKKVVKEYDGLVVVVDTHNIIPAWIASDKQEFAAHTMRTKVHRNLQKYLTSPPQLKKQIAPKTKIHSLSFAELNESIKTIPKCGIYITYKSGESSAHNQVATFLQNIEQYAQSRNNIAEDYQSGLSPYLHFGQISSLRVALEVINIVGKPPLLFQKAKLLEPADNPSHEDGMNALLEEMIVRKELADNFCFYSNDYLSLDGAPDWAKKSLAEHQNDQREFIYSEAEWEAAKTHDQIWNAAQTELTRSGKIHGYMRMYWAKKILEWSINPEEAVQTAIYLNDKYSIDGGDPNGYVGILWSIAGLHDRPWFERLVFGKIRYMNDSGLRRKFKVDDYIKRVSLL